MVIREWFESFNTSFIRRDCEIFLSMGIVWLCRAKTFFFLTNRKPLHYIHTCIWNSVCCLAQIKLLSSHHQNGWTFGNPVESMDAGPSQPSFVPSNRLLCNGFYTMCVYVCMYVPYLSVYLFIRMLVFTCCCKHVSKHDEHWANKHFRDEIRWGLLFVKSICVLYILLCMLCVYV